jgi:hypothetical protein
MYTGAFTSVSSGLVSPGFAPFAGGGAALPFAGAAFAGAAFAGAPFAAFGSGGVPAACTEQRLPLCSAA